MQNPQSLGDAARQARLRKQQKDFQAAKDGTAKNDANKDAQPKDAPANDAQLPKSKKVITNDEIPEHIGPTSTYPPSQKPPTTYQQPTYTEGKQPAEYWKSQIQGMKNYIALMETQIKNLEDSVQYKEGTCGADCQQWNAHQKLKEDQAETLKAQLEQMRKRLADVQEMARRQGYGSSVYDP